jgi:hypothetical protein
VGKCTRMIYRSETVYREQTIAVLKEAEAKVSDLCCKYGMNDAALESQIC